MAWVLGSFAAGGPIYCHGQIWHGCWDHLLQVDQSTVTARYGMGAGIICCRWTNLLSRPDMAWVLGSFAAGGPIYRHGQIWHGCWDHLLQVDQSTVTARYGMGAGIICCRWTNLPSRPDMAWVLGSFVAGGPIYRHSQIWHGCWDHLLQVDQSTVTARYGMGAGIICCRWTNLPSRPDMAWVLGSFAAGGPIYHHGQIWHGCWDHLLQVDQSTVTARYGMGAGIICCRWTNLPSWPDMAWVLGSFAAGGPIYRHGQIWHGCWDHLLQVDQSTVTARYGMGAGIICCRWTNLPSRPDRAWVLGSFAAATAADLLE